MTGPDVEPTLATVLTADLADYQEWKRTDPAGAGRGLHRTRKLFQSLAAKYNGSLVASDDESFRATFLDPADAVSTAVALHDGVDEANEDLDEEDKVDVRAGVALGPVVRDGEDATGNGVNSADALRRLCPAGSVMITGAVFEQARGRFGKSFRAAGTHRVGGDEMNVYGFVAEGVEHEAAPKVERAPLSPEERARASVRGIKNLYRSALMGGAAIVFLLLINVASSGANFWFQWPALVIVVLLGLRALRVLGPEGLGHGARRMTGWLRQYGRWPARAEREVRDRMARDGASERAIRHRVRSIRAFQKRATTFGVIVAFLFVINLLTSPGDWWVVWPALGLAFVAAMSAVKVYGAEPFLGTDWEERKREELRAKFERET